MTPGGDTHRANGSAGSFTRAVPFLSPISKGPPKRSDTQGPRPRAATQAALGDRGYGRHHRKLRERLAAFVASGAAQMRPLR